MKRSMNPKCRASNQKQPGSDKIRRELVKDKDVGDLVEPVIWKVSVGAWMGYTERRELASPSEQSNGYKC